MNISEKTFEERVRELMDTKPYGDAQVLAQRQMLDEIHYMLRELTGRTTVAVFKVRGEPIL